jgi:hypothetical protein
MGKDKELWATCQFIPVTTSEQKSSKEDSN